MSDSFALLGVSSPAHPRPDDSKYVEEYMAKYQHPPFPVSWCPYNQKGQSLDAYLAALRYFYTISNGMEILYGEICKCVILTAIPSDLIVLDIEDLVFDTKAFRKGEDCTLTDDQQEGLNGRDVDTVTGLLLHTMSECYFKKRDTIDKILEIQRLHKRFSELSLQDITEIETSLEKRNEELSPAFDSCLSQLNEKELHEALKKSYIETWKLSAFFSENESEQVQKMEQTTQKYWEAQQASEDKAIIFQNELRKLRAKCTNLENKVSELKERQRREADSHKKENEQFQKKLKENQSKIEVLLQENQLYYQKIFEIHEKHAKMETTLTKIQEDNKALKSSYENALGRESECKSKIKSTESEISKYKTLTMQFEAEKAKMQSEIDLTKAKYENLLTRLCEITEAELTQEKKDTTDLSDLNRPTKLGDRFLDIYNNEWTEALEELEGNVGVLGRAAVDFLLDVMMKSFRLCTESLDKETANCLRSFGKFPVPACEVLKADDCVPLLRVVLEDHMKEDIDGVRRNVVEKMKSITRERYLSSVVVHLQKTLYQGSDTTCKDLQRSNSPSNASQSRHTAIGNVNVKQDEQESSSDFLEPQTDSNSLSEIKKIKTDNEQMNNAAKSNTSSQETASSVQTRRGIESEDQNTVKKFLKESFPMVYKYSLKCFSICWIMRNHSPELHLDVQLEQGSEFDLNRFRYYTQTGKHVDFVVWPALHLHEGGPIIAKGVAQPSNRRKKYN